MKKLIFSLIAIRFLVIDTPSVVAQSLNPQLPDNLEFAGEVVPLTDPDVRMRLERELIVNTYKHSSTILILKNCGKWKKFMETELEREGIPKDFFYIAVIESELDPNSRSPLGAAGFWHFMENTANDYGLEVSSHVDERRSPALSTQAAAKYFKKAYNRFNSWTLVAAAFNRGATGIEQALKNQQVSNYYDLYLNDETYRYVFRILALKLIIESPETYGFNIKPSDLYQPYQSDTVTVSKSISNLPEFAKAKGISYRTLKEYNPWIQNSDYQLVLKENKKYVINLPKPGR